MPVRMLTSLVMEVADELALCRAIAKAGRIAL